MTGNMLGDVYWFALHQPFSERVHFRPRAHRFLIGFAPTLLDRIQPAARRLIDEFVPMVNARTQRPVPLPSSLVRVSRSPRIAMS